MNKFNLTYIAAANTGLAHARASEIVEMEGATVCVANMNCETSLIFTHKNKTDAVKHYDRLLEAVRSGKFRLTLGVSPVKTKGKQAT